MDNQPRMIPITEARAKLADLIDELDERSTVILVRRSRPAAIVMSPERYNALLEEIDHLDSQAAVLFAQLHPEENVSTDKLKAELGLMAEAG